MFDYGYMVQPTPIFLRLFGAGKWRVVWKDRWTDLTWRHVESFKYYHDAVEHARFLRNVDTELKK